MKRNYVLAMNAFAILFLSAFPIYFLTTHSASPAVTNTRFLLSFGNLV
jgi:hypothetical protein